MADTDRQARGTGWRSVLTRAREMLTPEAYRPAPDYGPGASPNHREQWLRQFDRVRDLLELVREVVLAGGWTGAGSWFSVRQPDGSVRSASLAESFALRAPSAPVAGACLVGIMVRLAEDPDRVATVRDVWCATDELHEAMHERAGHESFPPGRAYPMAQRRARLQRLTDWNDAPGRTSEDVIDLVDRAIARTIVGSVDRSD
ncbi:MAG: hypothetical protein L0H41_17280 [Microlunatus sp.]|nr:hypothetical protein [Microlunatus sp.]MDN5770567.1 hypothetical protein [Microlunatus sp.]